MNSFFDISDDKNLPVDSLPLKHLGSQRHFITTGRRKSDYWGTSGFESNTSYVPVIDEDYDKQFVHKLRSWMPVYDMDKLLEHHYKFYLATHPETHEEFLKHIRYVILPMLKTIANGGVCIELLELWLDKNTPDLMPALKFNTFNHNSIKIESVNAPVQIQQNADHSTQTQKLELDAGRIKEIFELIRKDIEQLDAKIRRDFVMEMDYAVTQLTRDKDVKPQLLNIGGLIKEVGIGTFAGLLSSPLYDVIKHYLGFK